MKSYSLASAVCLGALVASTAAQPAAFSQCNRGESMYTKDLVALRGGKNISMDTFTGKVSLVINVASF